MRVACVLERIRERLLDDPVGGQLDPDGELSTLAVDRELDRQTGVSKLADERRHVAQPGLRCERLVRVAAEHAEQATHLGKCAPPALFDRLQHLARRRVLFAEHAPLGARLHDDHRNVVGDHVVQLASDPRPLLDDSFARGDVTLALGNACATVAVTDDAPNEQHDDALDHAEPDGLMQACLRP